MAYQSYSGVIFPGVQYDFNIDCELLSQRTTKFDALRPSPTTLSSSRTLDGFDRVARRRDAEDNAAW